MTSCDVTLPPPPPARLGDGDLLAYKSGFSGPAAEGAPNNRDWLSINCKIIRSKIYFIRQGSFYAFKAKCWSVIGACQALTIWKGQNKLYCVQVSRTKSLIKEWPASCWSELQIVPITFSWHRNGRNLCSNKVANVIAMIGHPIRAKPTCDWLAIQGEHWENWH